MREQMINAFEEATMPMDCEQKIRRAMANKKIKSKPRMMRKVGIMAAVFALVIGVTACASPTVREAVQKLLLPDIGMTVYEEEDTMTVVYDPESPAFAEVQEGRLYFTGNGENLDITDQIGENKPFIYIYQDETGVEIALAVGYAGTLENFGIYQFLRYPGEDWFTGTGRNTLDPETETRYPWVDVVWEELDIPWPVPEG